MTGADAPIASLPNILFNVRVLSFFLFFSSRWLPPQLEEFDRQSAAKLSQMTGADAALLLEGFKQSGHTPSQDWLQAFAGG